MHISAINILEMMTDIEKIVLTSNLKLSTGFRLAYLRLTLEYSKGQVEGREDLTVYIMEMVTDKQNINIAIKLQVMYMNFRLACARLTLSNSEGQGQSHAHFYIEYLGHDDR